MKILIICSIYKPNIGGIEKSVEELCGYYNRNDQSTVILTKRFPFNLPDRSTFHGTPVFRVNRPKTLSDYAGFRKWLSVNEKFIKSDIIHIIGVRRPMPLVALILSKRWHVPVIGTFAGGDLGENRDEEAIKVWNEGIGINMNSIEQFDYYTAYSDDLIRDAVSKMPFLEDRIERIEMSIDFSEIDRARSYDGEVVSFILAVRRLEQPKGIDILVKSFRDVANEYRHLDLKIIGCGQEEENLRELVKKLELEDRVEFLGKQDILTVYSHMKKALIHVCPS
ncbi:MAG: glycosyltransferase family 4 protein, partial [Rickettsiales bacterium]|nr:glycosyltransferase family 4 protein [Rickettsiales bacterium]